MTTLDPAAVWDPHFAAGLAPDPLLTVSDWADAHRMLTSRSSMERGPWRTSRTPYLREVMDSLSVTSPVQRVVLMWGAQLGKTEAGNNWLGYVIHQAPGPFLLVQPTVDLAKKLSRQRVQPMIEACDALAERVSAERSRQSSNTVLLKEFPDGLLSMTGANSAAGLRQMPARFVFLDEVDAYPIDVEGEGDPVRLAMRAARNFAGSKVFETSTPTLQGRSRIERDAEAGDRRRYHVPCPECEELFVLEWKHLRWDAEDTVTDTRGSKGLRADAEPYMGCPSCGAAIPESAKADMLPAGQWIPEVPERSDTFRSYYLSSLYSPLGWFSWRAAVDQFLEATTPSTNSDLLRVFANHTLGETWQERGNSPPWETLYNRRERYKVGTVPRGAVILTGGADVQDDRIELEVTGWGEGLESWSVAYHVVNGDTAKAETWRAFEVLLATRFPHECGGDMPLRLTAVDSGYETQTVYNWCRGRINAVPVRGRDHTLQVMVAQPMAADVDTRRKGGRRVSRGVQVFPVGTDVVKRELYGWLNMEQPTHPERDGFPPGWCHFPSYAEEYFQQLTAEELVPRFVRGFRRYVWEKRRARNEALDCRVYARAAAAIVGVDRWNPEHWRAMREAIESGGAGALEAQPPARRRRRRREGGWLD